MKVARTPTVPNKYNLTVAMIPKLVVDRTKIQQPPFWRNNVVDAWCLSGSTAETAADEEFATYNEYWVGIYDEDAKAYAGKIRVEFSSYGGMCGYRFDQFYRDKDIQNELDLRVQELFLERMNALIDAEVFRLPSGMKP